MQMCTNDVTPALALLQRCLQAARMHVLLFAQLSARYVALDNTTLFATPRRAQAPMKCNSCLKRPQCTLLATSLQLLYSVEPRAGTTRSTSKRTPVHLSVTHADVQVLVFATRCTFEQVRAAALSRGLYLLCVIEHATCEHNLT